MSESVVWRVGSRIAAVCALALLPVLLVQPGSAQAGRTGTISSVEVEQTPQGTTRVILVGAQDSMYTAFLRENPRRLIIDLPEVDFKGVNSPIAVGEGLVSDVTFGAFGDARISPTTARVSIGLDAAAEYELEPQADRLVVTLKPAVTATETLLEHEPGAPEASESAEAAAPPAADADAAAAAAEPTETAEAVLETPEVAPTPGPRILGVSEQGSSVAIESDAPLEQVDSFVLENPDRIVIDLKGATSAIWPSTRAFEEGPVKQIRVGAHADKVRVVLDLRAPSEAHTLVPLAHGMRVDIQSAALLAAPEPQVADTQAVPASPAEAGPPAAPEPQVADTQAVPASPTEPAAPDLGEPSGAVSESTDTPTEIRLREETAAADAKPEIQLRDDPPAAAPAESRVPDEAAPLSQTEIRADAAPPGESAVPDQAAAPAESEVSDTAATSAKSVTVQSIQFESLPELDRVVLTLSARTRTELIQPDSATVIVDLPDAAIDPAHERRVDTRDFGGPVEMFSAFRSPEIPGPNVRVVLKRNGETRPRLDWQGTQLRIDFPHAQAPAQAESVPTPPEPAALSSAPVPVAPAPRTQLASDSLPQEPGENADNFGGPAVPAAIDLLEEGGFSRAKEYQGRHISLDFEDAEIGNILRMIAEVSNLNVIAGDEVKGKVTIRMVDVPWDQALDVVLLTKGLGFLRIGNILRIAPVDVLHREEEARLQERRAKEKLEDLVVKLQPVNYADVDEIKTLVSHLLSPRGTVNVDSRTSTLIIKDIPTVIQEATALVKAIDTATPQVLIEAKIVEASLDFSRALGATWGTKLNPSLLSGASDRALRLGDSTAIPSSSTNQATSFISANPISAAVGTLSLGLLSFADRLQLDLAIQAAESKNKGKVISSPRVVTLDNREATIQQGVAIAFTASTADSVNTTFVDAVLELKVTPHITADKSVIMKIKVSRNAPDLAASTGTVQGITKNETETEALVRDGQTLVLGGIYTVNKSHARSMMPYLADVPIIGVAFRSTVRKDVRKELLVFVTPRIVHSAASGG